MDFFVAVVESNDIRARDGGAVDSVARVVGAGVSCGIDEGRQVPSERPIVQVRGQVLRAIGLAERSVYYRAVAGDDGGCPD